MKNIEFLYDSTCGISQHELAAAGAQLNPEINCMKAALSSKYDTDYASINLSADVALRAEVMHLAQQKKQLKPTIMIVVGIGGSNLGTWAILEAVYGKFYNEEQPDLKIYFADTVDTDHIYDMVMLVEQEMEKGNNVIITIISKSGTTLETVANGDVFMYVLRKYKPAEWERFVVIITDEDSPLWKLAGKHHIDRLAIPIKVGGRYSVFSAVGLFPLAMIGVNIEDLHAGAHSILPACTTQDIFQNPAALSAAILAHHYRNGLNIHDTFLFNVDLENIGKWYRQLMGESIGKTRKSDGKAVGITPTVSIGSTDLHSVAQLYLGGPRDKFTTFVTVQEQKSNIEVPQEGILHQLVAHVAGRKLSSLMSALYTGVKLTYQKEKRPFAEIMIPAKTPYYIAQCMQFKMCEMIYLGALLDVNPFDQPHVELYKENTRKILR